MSIRTEKVSSVIKRVLAVPVSDIAHEFSAGLVTLTSVRMTNDLQLAKVYISIFGNSKLTPAEFITILENKSGELRYLIGKNVRLRFTPEIKFYLDDTFDQIDRIQRLIKSVKTSPDTDNN